MTAVVHLVWGPLGVAPLRSFLRSYHAHDAGAPHELVVVFNGVPGAGRAALLAELRDTPHRLLELERPVQDLAAYTQAAARVEHERLCCLNSYSTILAAGWLAKLEQALARPSTGLVAASGSWASLNSWVAYTLRLPSPYRGVLPVRPLAKQQFLAIEQERERTRAPAVGEAGRPRGGAALARLRALPAIPELLVRFGAFPTPHLRTNAFLVECGLWRSLRLGRIARKMDAYALESGRNSITRQVQRRGLRALLVARDGEPYEPERWPESRAFWQGDQEGLLIADNQTRLYAEGSPERRRLLATYAWGRRADLGHPAAPVHS